MIGFLLIAYGAGCWTVLMIWLLSERLGKSRSISRQLAALKPGDTVRISGGIYHDPTDIRVRGNKVMS